MNSTIKALSLLASIGFGGCVAYPYCDWEDEGCDGGTVEIYHDPYYDCWDCHTGLEVEIHWGGYDPCPWFDLTVVTPASYAGCSYSRDDFDRSESVICSDPVRGEYEIRASSGSDAEVRATLTVRQVEGSSVISESVRDISVPPWGTSVVPVRVD